MTPAAVVTGASSGIGAAIAERLAREGRPVVLAARRADRLESVANRCRAAGGKATAVVADVTRRADVDRLRDAALAEHGAIDAWVNNAGRGITRRVEEISDADLDSMFAVNLRSALYGIQAVLPHFKARGHGVIIQVGSILGRVPSVYRGAYAAAKHAMLALAGALRQELAVEGFSGISVRTILPGAVSTGFSQAAQGDAGYAGGMAAARERFGESPERREWLHRQTADEVAAFVVEALGRGSAELYTSEGLRAHALAYVADPDGREALMRPVAALVDQSVREHGGG